MVGKNVRVGSDTIKVQIWDTAGQERFKSLIPSYIKQAQIAIIVYDITGSQKLILEKTSFESVEGWIKEIEENKGKDIKIAIVGNKTDLPDKRTVPEENGLTLSEEKKTTFMEVSAKSGENVELLFHNLLTNFIETKPISPKKTQGGIFLSDS